MDFPDDCVGILCYADVWGFRTRWLEHEVEIQLVQILLQLN